MNNYLFHGLDIQKISSIACVFKKINLKVFENFSKLKKKLN